MVGTYFGQPGEINGPLLNCFWEPHLAKIGTCWAFSRRSNLIGESSADKKFIFAWQALNRQD